MPAARKKTTIRKNLFGLGKKETFSRSIQDAERSAYDAGARIVDDLKHFSGRGKTHHIEQEYRAWLRKQGLSAAGKSITKLMEREFKAGATGGTRSTKPPVKAAKDWQKKSDRQEGIRETSSFKGVKLFKLPGDEYTTSIDRDSRFDSLKDAKAFITDWKKNPKKVTAKNRAKKNPAKFDRCVKEVKAKSGKKKVNAYAVCTAAGTRNPRKTASNKKGKLLRKRKGNPEDGAETAYREFTGHDPSVVMEIEEKVHVHRNLWTVGKLVAWEIVTATGKRLTLPMPGFEEKRSQGRAYWDFDESLSPAEIVWLAANEKYKDDDGKTHTAGTQLFVKGGDQSINLNSLGLDPLDEKENTFAGTIERVWYRQKKKFEGAAETDFHHAFGKEGSKGILPLLLYHPRSEHMSVAGGRYQIAKPEGALKGVSPGIIG